MPKKRSPYHRPKLNSLRSTMRDASRALRLRELAYAYMEARQPESAIEILKGALVLDSGAPAGRISLALALYQIGDFGSALAWLKPLAKHKIAEAEFLRGRIQVDRKLFTEALHSFDRAIRFDPTIEAARLHRAALLLSIGRAKEALPDLDLLLQKDPTDRRTKVLHATAQMETGDAPRALLELESIEAAKRSVEQVLLQARAQLLCQKPPEQVNRTFEQGLRQFPTDLGLRLAFARHLAFQQSSNPVSNSRAIQLLQEHLDGDADCQTPSSLVCEAWFLLAELVEEEDANRAEQLYRQGLALQPDDPVGLTGFASLLIKLGHPSQAIPWLLRSILIDPKRPRSLQCLAKALCAIEDDDAVARWLGLLIAGLPHQAADLFAQLWRFVQETGRIDAYEDMRREGHRMKNLVAVLANRVGSQDGEDTQKSFEDLFQEWTGFLSRIHSLPKKSELFSPTTMIQKAIEEACENPDRVRWQYPVHVPLFKGHQEELATALANILRNALEATPADRPIQLTLRNKEGGRFLEIIVTDHGPGISLSDQRHLFDPGFSTKEKGSGVGLTIARRVVMAHGGRISVASAPGGPTSFVVRLPSVSWPTPLIPKEVMFAR